MSDTTQEPDIQIDVAALRRRYAEERAKRLRPDAGAQYSELTGRFADFDHDPNADEGFVRPAVKADAEVLIIGGGYGGLLAGAQLREAGIHDVRIVEKGADFGGTWYWNRYPGAACDVESYIYLPMLEELGYMPAHKYATAPEIFEHCRRLARHFSLYDGALFQTEVTDAKWDEGRQRWIVTTSRGDEFAARYLISCIGLFSKPKLPGIPGIESFQGHSFHSARWDFAYTGGDASGGLTRLADKTVGIIGTGSTAVQCVPHLGEWAKQLYVFQRTPTSVDERNDRPTDPAWFSSLPKGWQHERIANFTAVTSGGARDEDLVHDGWTDIIRNVAPPTGESTADPEELALAEMKKMERTRRRVDAIVKDKATADALKPYYHYFCKRPCFHDEYLQTFNRPNVTLVDTQGKGVERITRTGVVVDGKDYPVDCLIYATGFDFMTEFTKEAGFDIAGRDGVRLSDHWDRGARTLHGMQTAGFPNFFLISLVQAGVAINYVHIADEQSRHIAHIIAQAQARGATTVEATAEAEEDWVEEILAKAGPRRAFLDACTPGYYNFEGRRDHAVELNDLYAAGPEAYIRILEQWRAKGDLAGLKFSAPAALMARA